MKQLKKVIKYQDSGLYCLKLALSKTSATPLKLLSSQLYETPQRQPEDVAAVTIEQSNVKSCSGNLMMQRSLLIKIGLTFATDAFQNVLDGEDESKGSKVSQN